MRHILLTRYNIRTQFGASVNPLDPDWLEHRGGLFRRFCLPSIESQTNRDFEWFIFFHPETPPRHYQYLDGIATTILAEKKGPAIREVRKRLSPGPLLSTRIDNDDAVSPHFMARIREKADDCHDREATLINFPSGAVFNQKLGIIRRRQWPRAPFLSLLDKNPDPQTVRIVIDFDHNEIFEELRHEPIETDEPAWLRVIHEGNGDRGWYHANAGDMELSAAQAIFPCLAVVT